MKSNTSNGKTDLNTETVLVRQAFGTRIVGKRRGAGPVTVITYSCPAPGKPDRIEHDPKKRTLRLTRQDGTAIAFRDQPMRFLVVEPDPRSGKLRPAVCMGKAKVVYLCPEMAE
jgi:hypothetical protein